jgi:hypothetical protein
MEDDDVAIERHPLLAGPGPAAARPLSAGPLASLDWRQALGGAFILAGVVAVMVAWFGISGTLDPGKQMPYLASGGIGGAALIALGVTLLLSFEHARDRAALAEVLDRLERLEQRLGPEPELDNGAPKRRAVRSGRR